MSEYIYVCLSALADRDYEPIAKVVPEGFKDRKYKDLVEFMIQESDDVGNAPLSPLEKELADTVRSWVDQEDANCHILVDVLQEGSAPQSYRLTDCVSSSADNFTRQVETAIDGNEVEYDKLDVRLRRMHTGGQYESP